MAEPTEEIQELLNFLLPRAERMLGEHGEFYPYAAALDSAGSIEAVGPAIETPDPDVGEVVRTGRPPRARSGHPESRQT